MYVALTQTASTLPFFLFALPLGSVGDIVDRRKLILYTETWMVCAAIALAVMTLIGVITPWIIVVVARWKRPVHKRTAPPETVGWATVAAIRYVRYAPVIRGLMLRSGVVMFFASGSFALLPTVAHNVSNSAIGYGILLGCFGAGAVGGALVMQPARARWSTEAVASIAVTSANMSARLAGIGTWKIGYIATLVVRLT